MASDRQAWQPQQWQRQYDTQSPSSSSSLPSLPAPAATVRATTSTQQHWQRIPRTSTTIHRSSAGAGGRSSNGGGGGNSGSGSGTISSYDARQRIATSKRIIVKVGTSVVSAESGHVALGRLGQVVEQVAELVRAGKQVILVSSGAVGIGRRRLAQQRMLGRSLGSLVNRTTNSDGSASTDRACAAAGQSGLMAVYDLMFSQFDITVSQVLVTDADFSNSKRINNLRSTLDQMLAIGVVPILNENDVISTRDTPLVDDQNNIFWDNDSLACLVGTKVDADAIVLLSDVDGLYRRPPSQHVGDTVPEVIPTFRASAAFELGAKSRIGRGGMQAKIEAARMAVRAGVDAVVIASGVRPRTITRVMSGEEVGTLFVRNPAPDSGDASTREAAAAARRASRALQGLSDAQRAQVLHAVASALEARSAEIVAASAKDQAAAAETQMAQSLRARLVITPAKVATLAAGIRALADDKNPTIGRILRRTELSPGLVLQQETCPLGVLLVIFESRPDVLPQVAALAIRSGNGVLMKGGSESVHCVDLLHSIVTQAVVAATKGVVHGDLIGLVHSRQQVKRLLKLDDVIDLVIPRGSGAMVKFIQKHSRIPVMGHAEGVCHVYIDESADLASAMAIVLDAKVDYPAACNAMETLLLHEALVPSGAASKLLAALRSAGVAVHGGTRAARILGLPPAAAMDTEYSSLGCTVEIVSDVNAAIDHIHSFGSGHTEAIVAARGSAAEVAFLRRVDAACVFANASTRFADGFRFGLGAEVGISTGRIHARGPVGVDGLCTTRWTILSEDGSPATCGQFSPVEKPSAGAKVCKAAQVALPHREYTHRQLPVAGAIPHGTPPQQLRSRL